eukprot:364761-Chlamydomonas_euryale.AAC.3
MGGEETTRKPNSRAPPPPPPPHTHTHSRARRWRRWAARCSPRGPAGTKPRRRASAIRCTRPGRRSWWGARQGSCRCERGRWVRGRQGGGGLRGKEAGREGEGLRGKDAGRERKGLRGKDAGREGSRVGGRQGCMGGGAGKVMGEREVGGMGVGSEGRGRVWSVEQRSCWGASQGCCKCEAVGEGLGKAAGSVGKGDMGAQRFWRRQRLVWERRGVGAGRMALCQGGVLSTAPSPGATTTIHPPGRPFLHKRLMALHKAAQCGRRIKAEYGLNDTAKPPEQAPVWWPTR